MRMASGNFLPVSLQKFLENGRNQKMPVSIYAEMTPNPSVLKFVANQKIDRRGLCRI